jgi:hypothetical protein
MARPITFLLVVVMMCCAHLHPPTPPSLFFLKEVLSLFAMPKVDPRNKVGAIVHAVSNRVLSDHTAKNIYGTVNYAKMFLQSTAVNIFGRTRAGGEECHLEVDGLTSRCPPKNLRSESN